MKIKGAKVRPVIEATVTELYVTFPTPDGFRMSGGKYDIDFTPARAEAPQTQEVHDIEAAKVEPINTSDSSQVPGR